jgi:hypothetical protein
MSACALVRPAAYAQAPAHLQPLLVSLPFDTSSPLSFDHAVDKKPLDAQLVGIDGTASFFIAHLVSSVIYHADRDKGKCDLQGDSD